jgi:hypothetical protein
MEPRLLNEGYVKERWAAARWQDRMKELHSRWSFHHNFGKPKNGSIRNRLRCCELNIRTTNLCSISCWYHGKLATR